MSLLRTRYIYIIGAREARPLKIGIATNLKARLTSLQIGHWQELVAHHTETVPATLAEPIEKALHKHFSDRHVRGEWFDIDLAEAQAALTATVHRAIQAFEARDSFSYGGCLRLCADPEGVQAAVTHYRNRANQAGVEQINAKLLSEVGLAAFTVFTQVVMEGRNMTDALHDKPELKRQAEGSMIRALNGLAKVIAADIKTRSAKAWRSYDAKRAAA